MRQATRFELQQTPSVRKSEAAVPLLMERQDLVGPYVTIFGHAPLQRGREHGGLSAADATLESAIIDNGPGTKSSI